MTRFEHLLLRIKVNEKIKREHPKPMPPYITAQCNKKTDKARLMRETK